MGLSDRNGQARAIVVFLYKLASSDPKRVYSHGKLLRNNSNNDAILQLNIEQIQFQSYQQKKNRTHHLCKTNTCTRSTILSSAFSTRLSGSVASFTAIGSAEMATKTSIVEGEVPTLLFLLNILPHSDTFQPTKKH